jgi:hypothetical protein
MRAQMGDFRIRCDCDTREGPLVGSQLTRLARPRKPCQAKTETDSADSILRQTSLVQRLPRNAKRQLLDCFNTDPKVACAGRDAAKLVPVLVDQTGQALGPAGINAKPVSDVCGSARKRRIACHFTHPGKLILPIDTDGIPAIRP